MSDERYIPAAAEGAEPVEISALAGPAETSDDAPTAEAAGQAESEAAGAAELEAAAAAGSSLADVDVAAIEAILFATDTPLSPAKLAEVACLEGGRRAARKAVEILNERYAAAGCAFRIESLAGGYQMMTLPEYNDVLARLLKVRNESKLTQAGLETLAIIAYKQPILRADVEAIRGVSTGEVVRTLMEKGLVKIVGRAEEIGRPMLYGTTRRFLEVFGLSSLADLPKVEELASGALAAKPAESAPAAGLVTPSAQPQAAQRPTAETLNPVPGEQAADEQA
jgi:segregation and condensation protein B